MAKGRQGFTHRLYTGQISYDFIGRARTWYIFSGILLLVCIAAIAIRGLNFGIEFRGGTDFQAPMTVTSGTVDEVRQAVDGFEVGNLQAQVFSIGDTAVRIQTRSLDPNETTDVRAAIAELAGVTPQEVTYNAIGASWGQQVSQQASIALLVFVVLVMLLIWVWFRDWKMSIAAIVALAHDLLVTVGIYALVGFTVTPATLIGVLTILGYSLYDTVVVFDKIKENVQGLADSSDTYTQRANLAVNQVLVRSLNTTIIGVLPVAALLVGGSLLGTGPLQDLGLALFVGMLAGAYSSLFLASPVLVAMKEREPAQIEHREAIQRRAERARVKEQRRLEQASTAEPTASRPAAVAVVNEARQQRRTRTTRAERRKK